MVDHTQDSAKHLLNIDQNEESGFRFLTLKMRKQIRTCYQYQPNPIIFNPDPRAILRGKYHAKYYGLGGAEGEK